MIDLVAVYEDTNLPFLKLRLVLLFWSLNNK